MNQQVIDLTLTFANGKRGINIQPELSIAKNGFNTSTLSIYSHALTHMDAQRHFIDGGDDMQAMNLQKCVGEAEVLDLSHKSPNSLITVSDMQPYEDRIHEGTRLLIRTDWDVHADDENYRTHFPRISAELAQWLVDKGIWLIGLETPSVASLHDENIDELTTVHKTLLGADVVIIESLCNLRDLPDTVTFIALPLKLAGGDGSPVRAVALIESEEKPN